MAEFPKKKIVIIGDGYVGKTCILHAIKKQRFEEEDLAINVYDEFFIDKTFNNKTCILHLVDTPGQEEYDAIRRLMYRHVDLFLICFAVNDLVSYQNIKTKWMDDIKEYPNVPRILVGTKLDLRDNSRNCIGKNDAKIYQKKVQALFYVECSAKTNTGIDDLIHCILQSLFNNKKTCLIQ